MAITFPLAPSVFADRLKIAAFRWQLVPFVETSGTALGQVISNEIAPRRWRAEVELARMPHAEAADIQALIDALGPSGTFTLHNPAQLGPRDDPTGSAVAGHAVVLNATSDNKALQLAGLPAGYRLQPRRHAALRLWPEPGPPGAAPHRRGRHRRPRRHHRPLRGPPVPQGRHHHRRAGHPGPRRGADDARAGLASIPAAKARSTPRAWPSTRSRSADARHRPCRPGAAPGPRRLRRADHGLDRRAPPADRRDRGARALVRRGQRDDHRHRPLDRRTGDAGLPRCGVAPRHLGGPARGRAQRQAGAAVALAAEPAGDRCGQALRSARRAGADLAPHAVAADRACRSGCPSPGSRGSATRRRSHGPRRAARRSWRWRWSPPPGSSRSRTAGASRTPHSAAAIPTTASAATRRSRGPSTCRGARRTADNERRHPALAPRSGGPRRGVVQPWR